MVRVVGDCHHNNMKNFYICYVLLVLCTTTAFAQFIGQPQQPQFPNGLSPQQQGHILSDVQQHHRFNPFPNQQYFNQLPIAEQNQLLQQQLLQNQQLLQRLQQQQQALLPAGDVVQHHTQTSFTPSFVQRETTTVPNGFQPRPTQDPILAIEQQIRQLDPEKHKLRIKELREKQGIIEKHHQFVERQYEKALKKAQADHQEFVDGQREQKKKLYQRVYKPNGSQEVRYSQSIPRYIYPEETPLFKVAVDKYYEEHPTTTTTTTPAPTTTTKRPKKSKLITFLPTALPTSKVKTIKSLDDLNVLQKQYKSQQIAKDDLLEQLRLAIGNSSEDAHRNVSSREISLANGKKVQLIEATDPNQIPSGKLEEITLPNGEKVQVYKAPKQEEPKQTSSSVRTQEITLPNGQRVEVIKTTDPKLVPGATPLEPGSDLEKLVLSQTTTTNKPPTAVFDELTKSVIPAGANFELLKTGASGGLEQAAGLPNQKKVTFVLLEEQDDGTLKVQGVKGSGKDKPEDVDSILTKIKNGEIKLPPNVKKPTEAPIPESTTSRKDVVTGITVVPNSFATSEEASHFPILKTNIGTHFVATSTPSSTIYTKIFSSTQPSTTARSIKVTRNPHILNQSQDLIKQASSATSPNQNSIYFQTTPKQPKPTPSSPSTTPFSSLELPEVLKTNGLFAMAKFLKQSGLDTILNETGPYTIFAPTDKAFRTLLVQLGGPEKAEEKFRENPRLLSGLLLHHVIPGAFMIGALQDEMTGVSLAGTQLRVNQYNMHDVEWNDVKITTINGAKVLDEKKDIEIPQGVAHAVDRVMFPLPVGDIVQTLQSDRERRFTNFLRALFSSGLAETLQGTKTFTLFAPTDKAFSGLSSEDLTRMVTDRTLSRELVFKHLTSGTLYTNGMRYYQIRESLLADKQLTLSKQTGKVKVNNVQITTQNIPATNGVIHAIDTLL